MRRRYGAGPLHLLAGLTGLAVAGWGLAQAFDVVASPANFVIWLAGAVIVHDLVLLPVYSLLDRVASSAAAPGRSRLRIAALNHVRVPVLLSGLALLVWFPLILGLDPEVFERAAGTSNDVFFERWLALTAALFAGSALVLALRARSLS